MRVVNFFSLIFPHFSAESRKDEADSNRPIPPYDADTTLTEEIYPIHNVIPVSEWKSLGSAASALENAVNTGDRKSKLPWRSSDWVSVVWK